MPLAGSRAKKPSFRFVRETCGRRACSSPTPKSRRSSTCPCCSCRSSCSSRASTFGPRAGARDGVVRSVNFRNTAAIAILFVALGGYLYFFESGKIAEEGEAETLFPEVEAAEVNGVTLTYPDKEIVV